MGFSEGQFILSNIEGCSETVRRLFAVRADFSDVALPDKGHTIPIFDVGSSVHRECDGRSQGMTTGVGTSEAAQSDRKTAADRNHVEARRAKSNKSDGKDATGRLPGKAPSSWTSRHSQFSPGTVRDI
jgi:hypothetical protein